DQVQYAVSLRARLAVADGDQVEVGQQLTEGSVNPHEKLRVEGVQALQMFQVEEVQQVYRSQGVTIADKHSELIVRQMLRKENVIIGKLIPAGTGMSRYRNVMVKIKPEAIPEYWLARQREQAREEGEPEPIPVGSMTREEAERALGGSLSSDE